MAKLKHPISCKALTKPPKDQKPPPFTGGFVPNKPIQNKVYSFDLTKVDALFDEMLLQKAIETPHGMPKPEELKGEKYCRWHNSWNHSTNSCVVFGDVIREGITAGKVEASGEISRRNNRSLSSTTSQHGQPKRPNEKRTRPTTETSSSRGRMVSKETNERPKATISTGMVLRSKCKCEAELEVVLNRQSQPMPKTNSARKGKEPEKPPQAEQAVFHSQKMLKTKSPDKLHVHLTSSSDKQLEASQVEGEPEPVPAEKQEDWIEENEEEQLDYEPSTDDQNALLGMEGQEDWTEEYGEEQMEYDGELDTETEAFGAELEGLLQGDLGINMVHEQLCFSKPTKEMANHLVPLFITANFGGVPVPKKDLIPTRLTVTNFAGGITKTHGILDVDVIVGSKEPKIAFFVVDTTSTTYNALLGETGFIESMCSFHSPSAISSWNEEGYMEIVEADPRPFLAFSPCVLRQVPINKKRIELQQSDPLQKDC
ncbi:unnamed protein product [Prunus brigantina]